MSYSGYKAVPPFWDLCPSCQPDASKAPSGSLQWGPLLWRHSHLSKVQLLQSTQCRWLSGWICRRVCLPSALRLRVICLFIVFVCLWADFVYKQVGCVQCKRTKAVSWFHDARILMGHLDMPTRRTFTRQWQPNWHPFRQTNAVLVALTGVCICRWQAVTQENCMYFWALVSHLKVAVERPYPS